MATVVIYPTRVRTAERSKWINESAVLEDDTQYGVRQAGTSTLNHNLYLDKFSAGLPQEITLGGITVRAKAAVSSAAAQSYLSFGICYDGINIVSQTKPTTPLTTSFVQYSVGGGTDLWGLTDRYVKRPFIHGKPLWTVAVNVSGSNGTDFYLQYLDVQFTYTLNTNLRGERSIFPVTVARWPYTSPADIMERKFNGTSPKHQVKSEDLNFLGDALYSVQTTVLNSTGYVRLVGPAPSRFPSPQNLSTISMMLTGTWAGGASNISHHAFVTQNSSGRVIISDIVSDLTSRRSTRLPFFPPGTNIKAYHTQVEAWVRTAGGGCIPLTAVAEPFTLFSTRANDRSPWLTTASYGFTLMTANNMSATFPLTYMGAQGTVKGATVAYENIPAGTVFVKFLALGGSI